ncbi:MAG: pentapeptide repeat-containing protein, partial [Mariprofundaceae bacterium]
MEDLSFLALVQQWWGVVIPVSFALLALYGRHIIKENRRKIGDVFRETVVGLSSTNLEIRMSSAVLLRRFFDKKSELGVGRTPYAKDAVDVIAAVLKTLPTSHFQKVLADGIRFAPSLCLKNGDFQGANFSKAFLSKQDGKDISMEGADFFQADLSGAQLKEAVLNQAQFYEATLYYTKFNKAKLRNANFTGASLHGVDFRGADLTNASFEGATLREVNFTGATFDGANFKRANGYGVIGCPNGVNECETIKGSEIFISRPGVLDARQKMFLVDVKEALAMNGFNPVELNRGEYNQQKVLSNLVERVEKCTAMVVFGFRSTHIIEGAHRYSTADARTIKDEFLSTPWNHIEVGIAISQKMPLLMLVDEGVTDGAFASDVKDSLLFKQQ